MAPGILDQIPRSALLPWETRIRSFSGLRCLRTLVYALRRYPRYLDLLSQRRDRPIYQSGRLVLCFVAVILLVPFVMDLLGSFIYPILSRGLTDPDWVVRFWLVTLEDVQMRATHSLPSGCTALIELTLLAWVLVFSSRMTSRTITQRVAVLCLAPPVAVACGITKAGYLVVGAAMSLWRFESSDVLLVIEVWFPTFLLGGCCSLVLVRVCGAPLHLAIVVCAIAGGVAWFDYVYVAQLTLFASWITGGP